MCFEIIPHVFQQILYLGHTGSGKSTLLFQLEKRLNAKYKVIRFSVQEILDVKDDLSIVDLIYAMYVMVFSSCKDLYKKADEATLTKVLSSWNKTIINETEETQFSEVDIKANASLGISAKIASLFVKLTSIMKMGTSERTIVRDQIVKNINEYISLLNELSKISSKACGKPILLMLEDLEKIPLEAAKKIFIHQSNYFYMIKFHMLLTTPIYLQYFSDYVRISSQDFATTEKCSIISINNKDKTPYKNGIDTLEKIIYARVSNELIEETALKEAIAYSSGVLRDLLQMIFNASLEAELNNRSSINCEDVKKSFSRIVNDYGI